MPNPAFTLEDFQFLGKYDPAVNYGRISDAEKAQFVSIRERLKEVIATVAENDRSTAWNTHVSILNPSGRTAKDYWCAIYPPGADNKSYAPQVAAIVLPRGVEICFCLGAGEGSFADSADRMRNEQYLSRVRDRLKAMPEHLRGLLRRLPETWQFRQRWRLAPGTSEFGSADEWLDYAATPGRVGPSVSRYLTAAEASQLGDGLTREYEDACRAFAPILLYLDGETVETPTEQTLSEEPRKRVWLIAAGEGARMWDQFRSAGEIAMGFPGIGDLGQYRTRDEVAAAIRESRGNDIEPINDALACYEFVHEMKPEDVVYVKRGLTHVLGRGVIASEYFYDPNRPEYRNVRKVRWERLGEWELTPDISVPVKTLTEITRYDSAVRALDRLTEQAQPVSDTPRIEKTVQEPLYGIDDGLVDTFLTREEWVAILNAWSRKKNLVLQGSPGVGKTFLARRLAYSLLGRKAPSRVATIQFHQSYSYEEFVEGYRPVAQGLALRDGFFKDFCSRARADSSNTYVLIIDEINRGNLSRIFGELLALIEADKRSPDHAVRLAYSGPRSEPFHVPHNVYLLGLMNTADRSLALVDYALRRRFAFRTISPAFSRRQFSEFLESRGVTAETISAIVDRLSALNEIISADQRNLGPGYQIGHSYFCPQLTEDALGESWYRDVIESEILPLIDEYWTGMQDKIAQATSILLP